MNLIPPTDDRLWKPSVSVIDIDKEVLPHLIGMRQLMRRKHGAGLAAPQIGINFRFFITSRPFALYVNPWWVSSGGGAKSFGEEGCLSFPAREPRLVERHTTISAHWQNGKNERQQAILMGAEARVFQHECDHLDGRCIYPKP